MSIEHIELSPGYPVIEIKHPAVTARVALHGAHLMEWTPAGREPVLYLSPDAIYQKGKAIRGGVPVCWPWFGPHESDGAMPAHGVARNRFWTLEKAEESADGVKLLFILTDDAATRALWPHAFRLEYEMTLGAELRLSLRMQNPGTEAFKVTGALHSYFRVGDIRQVGVAGLAGAVYLDHAEGDAVRTETGEVRFNGEVDSDYLTSEPVTVIDPAMGRKFAIQSTGSGCTVVWNPWLDKARRLTDLPDEDYRKFVCVETANAWRDRITVEPGGTHELAARIQVTSP
ncbi:MAG: putative glucose-6-phosphate 1-epimerase [Verrucomicrobiales bacterium]|nr:putative glucose-6-phosphate 1-epimerase [Verrucomicrobiales bacterium]